MKPNVFLLLAALLVPGAAVAADFSTTLVGQAGQGVASLQTGNGRVTYTLLTNGIGQPTRAVVLRAGNVFLNLDASFTAGSSAGEVAASNASIRAIEAAPGEFLLRVEGPSGSISGTLAAVGSGSNPPAGEALSLLGGRLRVQVSWENQFNSTNGDGQPIPSTDFAGYFWFDDERNIELAVKALDFGDRILFFYGQLTNLFFTITVTDTQTGEIKTYGNGPNNCGAVDENAFVKTASEPGLVIAGARLGVAEIDAVTGEGIPPRLRTHADRKTIRRSLAAMPNATCAPSASRLCLLGNRMQAELVWRNPFTAGSSGAGQAVPLSDLTGAFAFDDARNLEVIVKALDFGDRILLLWGSLSNFEYGLTVTDTATGQVNTYNNQAGTYCGGSDNEFNN
jgi:hypothetical protein